MMNIKLLEYFNGDELACDVWKSKYQVKDSKGEEKESTPKDMHRRLAKEFAKKEFANLKSDKNDVADKLSKFGIHLQNKLLSFENEQSLEDYFFSYLDKFKYIVPQGSIMSILGHPYKTGSLSNCFVVPSPKDSYGGILKTDEHLVQLMKRRGGVGTNLNHLRPTKTLVSNAAGSSTGATSFAERYSNSTREVAQDGRRGALMLLLSCMHPDIFRWATMKKDRTKVTGANISILFTDHFMKAAENNEDFLCRFPIDYEVDYEEGSFNEWWSLGEYNKLWEFSKGVYFMKIHAKELFDLVIEMAWENAEPGVAFIDRIVNYSPDGVYEQFMPISCNPCGEQWLQAYDSCRLFALNLFNIVVNSFTEFAYVDFELLYEISYIQQYLADILVDLEIIYVQKIINKIKNDPEPDNVKRVEIELWQNILNTAKEGRRTGCGFTALADALAALNVKYDSDIATTIIDQICSTKMRAELDCTIDLAILRGSFEGFDCTKEFKAFQVVGEFDTDISSISMDFQGMNDFYKMLYQEFPEQVDRMYHYGRRNVSWSTVAPTGTVNKLAA